MSQSVKQSHEGFTILELLVVVGILCILLAFLLPAIGSVREAARQSKCTNNIRQLVLGTLNYESAHQHLPPAAGMLPQDESPLPNSTDRYSGFLSFFSFMGRYSGTYFDQEVVHEGVTYPAYPDVDTTGYPLWAEQGYTFLCPSLPVTESNFASTHYAFSIGDVAKNVHSPESIRGAFAVGRTQTLDDITDGTSNTIGLAELGGFSDRSTGRRFAINQPTKYLENPSLTAELADNSNRYLPSVELSRTTRGGNWANGTGGPGLVNTILPPGSPTVLVGGQSAVDGLFSASENHRSGTIVGLCDGSTRFISSDIDVGNQQHSTGSAKELDGTESHFGVWGALGSSNGAENVGGQY